MSFKSCLSISGTHLFNFFFISNKENLMKNCVSMKNKQVDSARQKYWTIQGAKFLISIKFFFLNNSFTVFLDYLENR